MPTPPTSKSAKGARHALRVIALGFACIAACAGGVVSCAEEPAPKSADRIILIVVDTLRRDHVSAYPNAKAKTPSIDHIASTGQTFTNAVSAFHATTMSMASLFTGRTPSIEAGKDRQSLKWNTFVACGMTRFLKDGGEKICIPSSVPTLAEDMKRAGYWTLGVVSNQLLYRPSGYDRGFDQWVEVGLPEPGEERDIFESSPVRTAKHVNHDLEQALASRPSDHFFLYAHYLDVHDYDLFERDYAKGVEQFDRWLGKMFDMLDANGLLDGATVVITSDHGELLAETYPNQKASKHFGNPSYQPVLDIPLIVSPATNRPSDQFTRSQDIRGMIQEMAGLPQAVPKELGPDEQFISEMFFQTYRDGRWKSQWPRTQGAPHLYDLVTDPGEKSDLALEPSQEHAATLRAHRVRIDELSRQLATHASQAPALSDEDKERLRALGYIETTDDAFGMKSGSKSSDAKSRE